MHLGMRVTSNPAGAHDTALAHVALAIAHEVDLERMVDIVLDQAIQTLGAHAAHVHLLAGDGSELHLVGHRNLPGDVVALLRRMDFDTPVLAARAAKARRVQMMEDPAALDPSLTLAVEMVSRTGSASVLSVPLLAADRLMGVLTYTLPEPHRFTKAELSCVRAIAGVLAIGLANAQTLRRHQQAEGKCRALLEAVPDATVIVSDAGTIVTTNWRVEDLFGHTAHELIGADIAVLLPDYGHRLDWGAHYLSAIGPREASSSVTVETYGRRKDGGEIPIEVSLRQVEVDDGSVVITSIRDISDRRRAEEALRASEARFRKVFDEGPIAIGLVGTDYRFRRINRVFAQMLGYDPDDVVGMSFLDVTHPDDVAIDDDLARQVFADTIPSYHIEKRYLTKSGEVVWTSLTATVLRDDSGAPQYGLAMIEDITERKRIEQERDRLFALERRARAEAEAERGRLQIILDNAPCGIIFVDHATHRLAVNDEACRIFGRDLDPNAGPAQYAHQLRTPNDRPVQIEELPSIRVLHDGAAVVNAEYVVVRPDGSGVPILATAVPIRDQQGTIVAGIGIFQDITVHKQAAEARGRLAAIVESSDDAIISKTLDGTITSWNPAAERMYGYTADEALGQSIDLIIPGDRREELKLLMATLGSGTRVKSYETVRVGKAGTPIAVSVSISPLRDSTGEVVGAATIARDITERKRAEHERERLLARINEERSWLQSVINCSPVGIVLVEGGVGHWIRANQRAEELIGHSLSSEGGLRKGIERLRRPDGSEIRLEAQALGRALRGDPTPAEELLVRRVDGREIPILLSAASIRDAHGNVLGAILVFEDITPLKELEQLRQEWASVVTHDLRQPVAAIALYAEMLTEGAEKGRRLTKELERKALGHIQRAAQNLHRMIADLRDYSLLETRRLALSYQAVDLSVFARQVVERAAAATEGHPVRIVARDTVPPVQLDALRIEQALTNLLSNAAKYGFPDTEIRVELSCVEGEVCIAVINQGEGIAPEELADLFTRFHRVHAEKRTLIDGLGLGLYIVKGIVEAHGGRIWVESVTGGTTAFRFTVPCARPMSQPAPGDPAAAWPASMEQHTP